MLKRNYVGVLHDFNVTTAEYMSLMSLKSSVVSRKSFKIHDWGFYWCNFVEQNIKMLYMYKEIISSISLKPHSGKRFDFEMLEPEEQK